MDPIELVRRLLDLPRAAAGVVASAPARVAGVWDEVEALVGQAAGLASRLDLLVTRVEREADDVHEVVARVRSLVERVEAVVEAAASVVPEARGAVAGVRDVTAEAGLTRELADAQVRRVRGMLDEFEGSLRALAPVVAQVAREVQPRHVTGVAALLDTLPRLVDRIEPALTGMAGLVPELEQVTEKVADVGQVVDGLPGAGLLRRRSQAREDEEPDADDA